MSVIEKQPILQGGNISVSSRLVFQGWESNQITGGQTSSLLETTSWRNTKEPQEWWCVCRNGVKLPVYSVFLLTEYQSIWSGPAGGHSVWSSAALLSGKWQTLCVCLCSYNCNILSIQQQREDAGSFESEVFLTGPLNFKGLFEG